MRDNKMLEKIARAHRDRLMVNINGDLCHKYADQPIAEMVKNGVCKVWTFMPDMMSTAVLHRDGSLWYDRDEQKYVMETTYGDIDDMYEITKDYAELEKLVMAHCTALETYLTGRLQKRKKLTKATRMEIIDMM